MTTSELATPVTADLDVQAQLLDLYGADLSAITLWRCVVECRRALDAVGRLTNENLQRLATDTVTLLLSREPLVGAS